MSLYKILFEHKKYRWYTGIIGFAIIVGLIGGVLHYEATTIPTENAAELFERLKAQISQTAMAEGKIKFVEEHEVLEPQTGTTEEGTTDTVSIKITRTNLTRVVFTLSWEDDYGTNDEFQLIVNGPSEGMDGEKLTAESEISSDGTIILELDIGSVDNATVDGWQFGTGEWLAEITAVNCPGIIAGGILPNRPDMDDGNSWMLSCSLYYYIAEYEPTATATTTE